MCPRNAVAVRVKPGADGLQDRRTHPPAFRALSGPTPTLQVMHLIKSRIFELAHHADLSCFDFALRNPVTVYARAPLCLGGRSVSKARGNGQAL